MLPGDWFTLGIIGMVTSVGAIYDVRTRKVPLRLLIIGATGVIIGCFMPCALPWNERLIGLIPGIVLVFISCFSKAIGKGDACLVVLYGAGTGFTRSCLFLLMTFVCLMPAALLMVAVKKKNKKDTIPFYPFAAVGFAILVVSIVTQIRAGVGG